MDKQKFIEKQLQLMKEICKLHENVKHLDKSLNKLQPIAIVNNNKFYKSTRKRLRIYN